MMTLGFSVASRYLMACDHSRASRRGLSCARPKSGLILRTIVGVGGGERPTSVEGHGQQTSKALRIRASVLPGCVAQHIAWGVGSDEFLAQLVERGTIIVGDGDDVALRPTHTGYLFVHHDRLTIADQ